jgi:hypothetical protein
MNAIIYTYDNKNTCVKNDVLLNISKELRHSKKNINYLGLTYPEGIKEDTNSFSYFFVKYALIKNVDRFFDAIDPLYYTIDKHNEYMRCVLYCLKNIKFSSGCKVNTSSLYMTILKIKFKSI